VARFLLIDDDPAVSLTLARMLEVHGHRVSRLTSAEAGFAEAISNPPDALILDIRMPEMGGVEFLRRMRQVPGLAALPVGVITGDYFLGEPVLAELTALGATVRYNPVWMDDLKSLIDRLLARPA
jgi:CheY-like chemotaxis protein